jgi:hypothetical protein
MREPWPGSAALGPWPMGLLPAVPPPELMSPTMHRGVLMEQQDGQPVLAPGWDRPGDCVPAFGAGAGTDGQVCRAVCEPAMTSARDSALTWLG